MGEAASSDEEDLPAMSAEGSGPRAAIDAAETATDYSKKHSKMRPATDFAAASDYVAIDPFVVLLGERWISLYLNLAGVANYYSTRRTLMDAIAHEFDPVRDYYWPAEIDFPSILKQTRILAEEVSQMEVHSAAGSKDVGGEAAAGHYAVVAVPAPAFGSILHTTQFEEEFEVIVPMDSGQKYTEGEAAVAAAAATSGAEYFDQWNCLKLLGGWH
mmetsp:Transcript_21976/g.37587  ORF Transcript_21976/g.37587 Transcript_21976/m.37587 type:complete len:215 (-) Transcript_21976:767-1411(-)